MTNPEAFPIAVTGHRDLRPQDLPGLRGEVEDVFAAVRQQMPGQPLIVLNGLAEGADQFVAEVARKQGIPLHAILPMPFDIYRQQLTPEAQQKLDDFYATAARRTTLPCNGYTRAELESSEDARAQAYESLAHYLVGHGKVLLALWDGVPSDKAGGTCRVVDYARFGTAPGISGTVESHCEAVYQVVTPRLSGTEPAPTIQTNVLNCPHPNPGLPTNAVILAKPESP